MRIISKIDEFYDIVFQMDDGSTIKSKKCILMTRSEYFRSMLDPQNDFIELNPISKKFTDDGVPKVTITGVPKIYFSCILQYLYSDSFLI